MEHLILLDTSELLRPMPRKLHAAWAEIHGRKAAMPPTVAAELAPQGIPADAVDGGSIAEQLLKQAEPKAGSRRRLRLEQQAWWARMWRQPGSPYEVVELNDAQEELSAELAEQIDPRCFRNAKPGYVPEHRDTRIICESIALNAKMLLTSNMRSIDHNRVNEWTVANGERLGFTAEPVLYPADGTLVGWATRPGGLDRWLRAGLIGCWPESDDAPAEDVKKAAIAALTAMIKGTGGRLQTAGRLLVNALREHPEPERLVERTRLLLPSPTVTTDREHPSYPARRQITTHREARRQTSPNIPR